MSRLRRPPSFFTRLIAGAGVALVLLLSVLAASPEAHEWIHGHGEHAGHGANAERTHHHNAADTNEDGCVVTLFAHGVVAATIVAVLVVALFRLAAIATRPREAPGLPAPHYLLPPLCGPPQG